MLDIKEEPEAYSPTFLHYQRLANNVSIMRGFLCPTNENSPLYQTDILCGLTCNILISSILPLHSLLHNIEKLSSSKLIQSS